MASNVYFVVLVIIIMWKSLNAQKYMSTTDELCGPNGSTCAECFNLLVFEATRTSEHQYNLTQAFFPPTTSTPVYVTVVYYFVDSNGNIDYDKNSTWFWSTSTYYLYEPPAVLQFTSLFFADPDFRSANLILTLPDSCMKVEDVKMQLLTQRLQLIAMRRNVYPTIDANYDPKAENINTLVKYNKDNRDLICYLISMQVFLGVVAVVLELVVIAYMCCCSCRNPWIQKVLKNINDEGKDDVPVISDCIFNHDGDIQEARNSDSEGGSQNSSSEDEAQKSNNEDEAQNSNSEDERAIKENWNTQTKLNMVLVLSVLTSLYIFVMTTIGRTKGFWKIRNSNTLEIFSGVKENRGDLYLIYGVATILLVYDVVLVVFNFVVFIITLICMCCKKKEIWWLFCMLSPVMPIAHFIVHFTHIIIGFIHNEHHATSVGLFYAGCFVLQVFMFKGTMYLYFNCWGKESKKNHFQIHVFCYLAICICCSIILFGLLAYLAGLYILLPINNGFDEAPNRLNGIRSGIVVVFGGSIIYLLAKLLGKKKSDDLTEILKELKDIIGRQNNIAKK